MKTHLSLFIVALAFATACSPVGHPLPGVSWDRTTPAPTDGGLEPQPHDPVVGSPEPIAPVTWERGEPVPPGGRSNPYALKPEVLKETIRRGRIHPLVYPVEITGALIPLRPVEKFLSDRSSNPLRAILQSISRSFTKLRSFDDAMDSVGLHRFPANAGHAESDIPLPHGYRAGEHMGLSKITNANGTGFTISCAACHTGQLFGRPVMGMTNRFPRSNEFFIKGKLLTELAPTPFFRLITGATSGEAKMYRRTRHNLRHVESKKPEVLGLDTSLAHVALSLARRERDEFATKDPNKPYHPDDERLWSFPADSKPAVWWNVKFKNRYLSDGSVVSGNPIITTILWNEIGRGTDLKELAQWIDRNDSVITELTSAVFASQAPAITDFFSASVIDLSAAKRGQALFVKHCAGCHGTYQKAWDLADTSRLTPAELLKTRRVLYHEQTPVMDVGTDSHRAEGMQSLLALNTLKISKDTGVVIEKQKGYVPPPLVGIWARWPYFHNNSAPSLCAVLSPQAERPKTYWAGEPLDPKKDFDSECNGYPTGNAVPASWKKDRSYLYDIRRSGLSNAGHDKGIFVRDGRSVFTKADRNDLIQFLKTL